MIANTTHMLHVGRCFYTHVVYTACMSFIYCMQLCGRCLREKSIGSDCNTFVYRNGKNIHRLEVALRIHKQKYDR